MSKRATRALLTIALVLAASSVPAQVEKGCANHNVKWLGWQLQEENDSIALFSGSDEFYTQGLHLRFWRCPEFTPKWAETMGLWLATRLYPDKELDMVFGLEIGQHMFTPESIAETALIVDDRPYAGWLYAGLLFGVTEPVRVEERPIQQLFEIQFGVIGPESGAEWAQTKVHELINDEEPMGWDNQLPTELAVNLFYQWRRRIGSETFDVVPSLGGALGTVQIYLSAGASVRAGRHISDFGPAVNNATFLSRRDRDRHPWEAYVFAGAEGRAIARSIFLDGSTFTDSHSVDKETFVYDLKAGASVRYGALRFTYTFVRRSKEFDPLPAGGGRASGEHDFGSFNFSFEKKL